MNERLLAIALELSTTVGYRSITRDQIARAAGVSTGSVTNHLGTMRQLRRNIVRKALRDHNHVVVAQAIVANDSIVKKLSQSRREHTFRGAGLIE